MANSNLDSVSTKKNRFPQLTRVYDDAQIKRALNTEDDSLLNKEREYSENDLSIFVHELLIRFGEARDRLHRDYGLEITRGLDTLAKLKLQEELAGYIQEKEILISALKQALALLYFQPALLELVKKAISMSITRIPLTEQEMDAIRFDIEKQGLGIIKFDHSDGFNGNKRNHGTLVFNEESNRIVLYVDRSGYNNIKGLIHEFAAFSLIKASGKSFESTEDFNKIKEVVVAYVLLFIDMIATGAVPVLNYTNLGEGVENTDEIVIKPNQ